MKSTIAYLFNSNHQMIQSSRHESIPVPGILYTSIQQLTSAHPHWQTIVDLYNGMLPTSFRWLFFSSLSIECFTLANHSTKSFKQKLKYLYPSYAFMTLFKALATSKGSSTSNSNQMLPLLQGCKTNSSSHSCFMSVIDNQDSRKSF